MGTATRVLLIEDDGEDQFLFAKMLVRGGLDAYELRCVGRLGELEQAAREFAPDITVTDLHLPDSQGMSTFQRVKRALPSTPIVVLTCVDDRDMGQSAIELGAQDFLVKGEISPGALDRTLRHAITRAALQRASTESACFDDLTHLPNRVLLRDRLAAATQRAQRHASMVAAVFIDLDRFKPVNDAYGHLVGDELLRAVGDRLCASLRATDTVARWGGDEFVCVLEGVSDEGAAMHVAAQLHRALLRPFDVTLAEGPSGLELGASIGVAVLPMHASDGEALLRCADQAMYAAKRVGGGCVLWGSAGMRSLSLPPGSGEVPIVPRQRRVTWPTREALPEATARPRAGSGG